MKKVAFYGRYSSANQTEQSIEGQRHVCEDYAAKNGLQIVAEYIDRAQSGKTDKRQQFQQMISDSERGMFSGILVYKLDRFARDRYDSAIYKKKLRERGISVISATEPITDTPEGVIMEALIEGMDMYYSMELARKMNRGKAESVRKGKFVGTMPPIGYKVVDHRLVIDELTAPVVQEIFRRYTAGETQGQIIADLNRRGIPNNAGREWSASNISALLNNRLYTGTYAVKNCGEAPCPAIIESETWETAQKLREESVKMKRSRKNGYNFILTGKLMCAQCGASISGRSMQGGRYHYYCCRNNCTGSIPTESLHERVRIALAEYLTEDKLEELAQGAYAEYQSEQVVDERPIIEKEIADIDKQLQNAVQAILRGVELDALNDTVESLKSRREELRQRLNEIPAMKPELTYDMFLAMLQIIVDKAAESDDLTQLVGTVVNRIIIDGKAERVIICINLTNEDNEPPMDQIMFRLKDVHADRRGKFQAHRQDDLYREIPAGRQRHRE
ncbi:MAG: recombinase family protein [Oscillospiraceae bacterium]|nr:recombinase family protein [Oscillospiraceae bacterium]